MKDSNEQLTAPNIVEREANLLSAKRGELLLAFVEAAQQRKPSKMARILERLKQTNAFLDSLERIDKSMPDKMESSGRHYAISSLFLHECFKALTADRDEQFFFLTGMVVGGIYVLDQRLEFQHAKRSMVGVVG